MAAPTLSYALAAEALAVAGVGQQRVVHSGNCLDIFINDVAEDGYLNATFDEDLRAFLARAPAVFSRIDNDCNGIRANAYIDMTSLRLDAVAALFGSIEPSLPLRSLMLRPWGCDSVDQLELARTLGYLLDHPTLETLELDICNKQDITETLVAICPKLETTRLERFCIKRVVTSNASSDSVADGIAAVARAISKNAHLKSINVESWRELAPHAGEIVRLLGANKTLHTLQLSDCGIRDAHTLEIADALTRCEGLTVFSLQRNRIGRAGAQRLLDAALANVHIKKIFLEDTNSNNEYAWSRIEHLFAARDANLTQ